MGPKSLVVDGKGQWFKGGPWRAAGSGQLASGGLADRGGSWGNGGVLAGFGSGQSRAKTVDDC
jgi:hypothetical protein